MCRYNVDETEMGNNDKKIYRLLNCKHTVKGFVFRYMDSIKDIV